MGRCVLHTRDLSLRAFTQALSGFKKVANRATTQVMMKTGKSSMQDMNCTRDSLRRSEGHVEKTNDRDYEVEERFTHRAHDQKISQAHP